MADTGTNGHNTKAELERHLLELTEYPERDDHREVLSDENSEAGDVDAAKREIALLRKGLYDLREQLVVSRQRVEDVEHAPPEDKLWLRIATTVAVTFILGTLVRRMRLGAPGAAAVPLIAAQTTRQVW